jgi:hypothetical protein
MNIYNKNARSGYQDTVNCSELVESNGKSVSGTLVKSTWKQVLMVPFYIFLQHMSEHTNEVYDNHITNRNFVCKNQKCSYLAHISLRVTYRL